MKARDPWAVSKGKCRISPILYLNERDNSRFSDTDWPFVAFSETHVTAASRILPQYFCNNLELPHEFVRVLY